MKLKTIVGMFLTVAMCLSSSLFSEETPSVKPNGCKGLVLCPSFPVYDKCNTCCDSTWHIDIGLLYQQPWFSDMNAGTKFVGVNKQWNNNVNAGKAVSGTTDRDYKTTHSYVMEPCFNYYAGLTASLGHVIEHDHWFIGVEFDWISSKYYRNYNDLNTWYYANEFFNEVVIVKEMNVLPGLGIDNWNVAGIDMAVDYWLYGGGFSEVDYYSKISFYCLDFILSRGSYHSRCFSYEPFAGVKAIWYHGWQDCQYFSSNTDQTYIQTGTNRGIIYPQLNGYTTFEFPGSYVGVKSYFDAWGVGPMFGFNGEYYLTNQLSIFSDSDIAVLFGNMNTYNRSYYAKGLETKGEFSSAWEYYNSNQEYYVPVRSILGIKLAQYCLDEKHYLAVKVGYDARYIFTSNVRKDFALNGLYLNFIWDF